MAAAIGSFSDYHDTTAYRPQTRSGIASFGKVPEVALGFWIIKIAATTLGKTGAML